MNLIARWSIFLNHWICYRMTWIWFQGNPTSMQLDKILFLWTIRGPTGFSHRQISELMRVWLLIPLEKWVLHIYQYTDHSWDKTKDFCSLLLLKMRKRCYVVVIKTTTTTKRKHRELFPRRGLQRLPVCLTLKPGQSCCLALLQGHGPVTSQHNQLKNHSARSFVRQLLRFHTCTHW